MILFWTIIPLVLLLLVICFVVLRYQQKEIYLRRELLVEALFTRRNKIPLLLEVLKRAGVIDFNSKELIDIRSKLMSERMALPDTMVFEKKLTDIIRDIFRVYGENKAIKTESLFFVLEKELSSCLEMIRITLNDYNFAIGRWTLYCRMPWFMILRFLFKTGDFLVLQPI